MSPVSESQKESFRLALEALKETGLLPHVLVIGSWAEYLYQESDPGRGFVKHLQTRDLDIFLENLRKPDNPTGIVEALKQRGFLLHIDRVAGFGEFGLLKWANSIKKISSRSSFWSELWGRLLRHLTRCQRFRSG